jgi:hypothetical protein
MATCATTGTGATGLNETAVKADGTKTIILTLTGDTWIAGGAWSPEANQVLEMHFENNDDITQGTPVGGSTNATKTLTRFNSMAYSSTQKSDGTYSLYKTLAGTTEYATIPTDVDQLQGTLVFDLYVATGNVSSSFVRFNIDANNYILVYAGVTGADIKARYRGGGGNSDTTTVSMTTGTLHTITFKWRTGGGPPYLSIQVDSDTAGVYNSTLNTISGTASVMEIGVSGDTANFYIDNLKLYDVWL